MDKLIEVCISSKLTPDEYCILSLLSNRQYEKIRSLFDLELISEANFVSLETKGYIKLLGAFGDTISFESIGIREKTNKLFKSDEKGYLEYLKIWTIFPFKVSDGKGGYRILRAKSCESEDFKRGFRLWTEIIKKESPATIEKALENQLELTRETLQYTQNWLTWLRQKSWQKYIDIEDEQTKETEAI